MANTVGSVGLMRLFIDFTGERELVSLTDDTHNLGSGFYLGGEGLEDNDTGISIFDSDGLNGVARIIGGNTDLDCTFVGTATCFKMSTMAPFMFEARVRYPDLDTQMAYIGLTDIATVDDQISDVIDSSTATTLGIAASDLCGFSWSSELTEDEMWHCPFAGGSASTETVSTNVESGVDAVLGEFQILKLEVDPNGTARWYIDNVLVQTTVGAVSTTANFNFKMMAGANTTELTHCEPDYILIECSRDWTV